MDMRVSGLEDQYRGIGFSRRIGFGDKPALLIVDFIKSFTDPSHPLGSDLDGPIERTAQILTLMRLKGLPVVFTTYGYQEGFQDAGLWIKKMPALSHLKEGTPMVEIDPRVAPLRGETIIVKRYPSAFFGTYLASLLTSLNVDTVLIAGCTTSGCVRATVVDAIQHGFRPIVPKECVGDRAELPHEVALFDMDAKYGDVVSYTEVLDYLHASRP